MGKETYRENSERNSFDIPDRLLLYSVPAFRGSNTWDQQSCTENTWGTLPAQIALLSLLIAGIGTFTCLYSNNRHPVRTEQAGVAGASPRPMALAARPFRQKVAGISARGTKARQLRRSQRSA